MLACLHHPIEHSKLESQIRSGGGRIHRKKQTYIRYAVRAVYHRYTIEPCRASSARSSMRGTLCAALMVGAYGRHARLAVQHLTAGAASCTPLRCAGRRCLAVHAVAPVSEPVTAAQDDGPSMDEVINVCKRRGIIFQSSEVDTYHTSAPHSPAASSQLLPLPCVAGLWWICWLL